ncbi:MULTISPECIES: hypothetical protein [unclassified Brevundimonas]|jgi:hypothetical protein|uniref:hypothetical protein n=1 Tax=unclassified Brevundimonas TaxID=2622653 RepID=UPI000C46E0FF|nr:MULTISPECIES: hypothetical protein [unclassified Brevundimonas]MAL88591.1 hypothetical protein [Brevundimonas sp.]MAL89680.1 hypothetical protein [Brevundimonas sp.]HAJ02613.1 hypothetical protein [Brevundimonas sp.]HAV51592.1 hypothetical protein [Brevundimonas sp.]|tara:strand:+ start:13378 stop:13704 length:327 start_codon:yes stop_codon:yes gene_type:complete
MIRLKSGQLFGLLKALPMIRFALMLGGGMVATALAAHVQWWLQHGRFPEAESVWLARIQGATWMGLASTFIVALVMVTLAFGRAGRLGVKAGGIELDVDFDKPEEPEL